MSYTENALVIHRVGGLEVFRMLSVKVYLVIHRVGGLEDRAMSGLHQPGVIHRVGGIETTIWIKSLTH